MTEPEMEKYGVDEVEEDTKTAAEGKKCPTCGGALRSREVTGVLLCSKCGSKPFEASDKGPHAKPLK
jgi:ribosomal protein L37AE/L43A